MNIHVERPALSFARMWVVVYTVVLPQPIKQARRAEIESDLWEHVHDRVIERRNEDGFDLFRRVVFGIPSDLSWTFVQRVTYRREHQMEAAGPRRGRALRIAVVSAVVMVATLTFGNLSGELSAVGWTIFFGLFVTSLLTTVGALIFLAANLRTPRP